jgi:hypothetical protein
MFSAIRRVSQVRVSTSVGSTEDFPGNNKTSSNVRPSTIGPCIPAPSRGETSPKNASAQRRTVCGVRLGC